MDTTTSFLGFRLPHPFIAGASPLGFDLDTVKRLEDGGCAAIVIPSLFEEQITMASTGRIHQRDPLDAEWAAGLAHFPGAEDYALAPDEYAEHIARVKRTVAIPVIASLNGASGASWLTFSRIIEQAGADALELNLYEVVTDLSVPGAAVEHELTHTVSELKQILKIPIAVKVSPFFAAFGNVARQLDAAGADGLVLFNRFYQPDIDTATMKPFPHVKLVDQCRPAVAPAMAGDSSRPHPADAGRHGRRRDPRRRDQGAAGGGRRGADGLGHPEARTRVFHGHARGSRALDGATRVPAIDGDARSGQPETDGRSGRVRTGELHSHAPELECVHAPCGYADVRATVASRSSGLPRGGVMKRNSRRKRSGDARSSAALPSK